LVTGLNRHLIFLFREFPKAGGTRCSCLCHFFFFLILRSLFLSSFLSSLLQRERFKWVFSAAFPSTENKNSTPTLFLFYKRERRSKNPKWLTPIAARCMTQAPPTSPGKKKTGMCRPEEEEVDDGGGW
jgi:hypothetical protein